jgi:hypothetical protein
MKYLLVITLCLSLSAISFAQDNSNDLQREFETWESSVLSKNENLKGSLFLMAKLKRDDDRSATVRLGFAGVNSAYRIQVTPLKVEKDETGKFISQEIAEALTISTPSVSKLSDFHSPAITFLAPKEANAVEISFKFGDKQSPKMTLELSSERESVGKLTSVK